MKTTERKEKILEREGEGEGEREQDIMRDGRKTEADVVVGSRKLTGSDIADIRESDGQKMGEALANTHNEGDALIRKIRAREEQTGRDIEVIVDEAREGLKLPLRVLYAQKKVEYSRSPLWYLQALGALSLEELSAFLKDYRSELSANEIAASDLILGVVKKDEVATARFWRLQEKMLNNKSIQSQINNIVIASDSAVKKQLDAISDGLFGSE